MTYKDELCRAMKHLSTQPKMRFIGYNVRYGHRAEGTLVDIPEQQLIETPVAENLIIGLATGYALQNFTVMAYIERFDFVLNAFDALINHLSKIKNMSGGQFNPNILIRTLVGNRKYPLFSGMTHTQDFSEPLSQMLRFPVIQLHTAEAVFREYTRAVDELQEHSTLLVEYRDDYTLEC